MIIILCFTTRFQMIWWLCWYKFWYWKWSCPAASASQNTFTCVEFQSTSCSNMGMNCPLGRNGGRVINPQAWEICPQGVPLMGRWCCCWEGGWAVLPSSHRTQAVHPWVVSVNALDWIHHWWPGISSSMKKLENKYGICQVNRGVPREAPTFQWQWEESWIRNSFWLVLSRERAFWLQEIFSPTHLQYS